MRALLIAAALTALGAIAFTAPVSAAVTGPASALTAPANMITEVRMMHRRMSSRRMHRRMSSRQHQHRRMWGN